MPSHYDSNFLEDCWLATTANMRMLRVITPPVPYLQAIWDSLNRTFVPSVSVNQPPSSSFWTCPPHQALDRTTWLFEDLQSVNEKGPMVIYGPHSLDYNPRNWKEGGSSISSRLQPWFKEFSVLLFSPATMPATFLGTSLVTSIEAEPKRVNTHTQVGRPHMYTVHAGIVCFHSTCVHTGLHRYIHTWSCMHGLQNQSNVSDDILPKPTECFASWFRTFLSTHS